MAITALSTPPSRSDPTNFASRSDTFLGQLPTFGTEANALAVEMNNIYNLAMSNGMANAATNAATATAKAAESLANAGVATTQNAAAGSSATLAQGFATAASVAKDAALAAWVAATYPAETLAAQSNIAHIGTVVDSCIDYPWTHSDGGAWTDRCQDKSWYKETLGGSRWLPAQATIAAAWAAAGSATGAVFQASATAGPLTSGKFYAATSATTATEVFRGIKREYPKAGVLWIAESTRVVGYDLGSGAMWMVFVVNGCLLRSSPASSIAALGGVVFVGNSSSTSGSSLLDFNKDSAWLVRSAGHGTFQFGNLAARNTSTSYTAVAGPNIINTAANDVAITVLDGAPIDPATGLPKLTVAVFTDGGVSVIKHDDTVVNITATTYTSSQCGRFSRGNKLVFTFDGNSLYGRNVHTYAIPSSSVSTGTSGYGKGAALEFYSADPSGTTSDLPLLNKLLGTASRGLVCEGAYANLYGITRLKENPATPAKGMVAYITNAYNSGWQVGDSRAALLADTVAETITGSGELVTNGTFATDTSGWAVAGSNTPTTATIGAVTGQLVVTQGTTGFFGQAVQTVSGLSLGKSYVFSFTAVAGTASTFVIQVNGVTVQATAGTASYSFVASGPTTNVVLAHNSGNAQGTTLIFDNISVKLAEPDRSVKNNGLIVNGTLQKSAVASGANLVAYSGFSAANYLEAPYSSNLDFGTGDFCVMGWVNLTSTSLAYVLDRSSGSGATPALIVAANTNWYCICSAINVSVNTGVAATTGLHHIALIRVSGVLYMYVDNIQIYTAANTANLTNASAVLRLGVSTSSTAPVNGSLALWRISATAPSADQIAQIYRDELPLFQPGAQCTIAGTSTAVTAMDYDSTTDLLHVGTSWGRTSFRGLLQVESEATTVGSTTSLAASGGTVVTSGTNAKLSAPSIVVRDALKDRTLAAKALSKAYSVQDLTIASFTGATTNGSTAVTASSISIAPYTPYVGMVIAGTGIVAGTTITAISGTAYTLSVAATATGSSAIVQSVIPVTRGYTVKIVSKNGLPIREATTGVYWTRSNDGYIEYVTPSVAPTAGDWFSFEIVRS